MDVKMAGWKVNSWGSHLVGQWELLVVKMEP